MKNKPIMILPTLALACGLLGICNDAEPLNKVRAAMTNLAKEADQILASADGLTTEQAAKVDDIHGKIDGLKRTEAMLEKQAKLANHIDSIPDDQKRRVILDAAGLSEGDAKDAERFSFVRMINGLLPGRSLEGVEKEMIGHGSAEARQLPSEGNHIPRAVLTTMFANRFRNDLTAGGSATGAEVLTREPLRGIVDPFYEAMVTRQLGAAFLSGLVGNVPFPKMGRDATKPAWATENGASTEITPSTAVLLMTPHRLPAHVELSKQFLLQTDPSVEAWVRSNLLQEIGIVWEKAVLHGTGSSNQPTGVAATAGIGSVAGGTNGLAPTEAHIIDLETALGNANAAQGSLGYLTNSRVRGKLKKTPVEAGTDTSKVWSKTTPETPLNGYRSEVSNCVSNTLTKGSASGVCSAIFFGNWQDLVIGQWGGLDVLVNPYSLDTTGLIRVTAAAFGDSLVLRPESFSAMLDALTT